MLMRTLVIAFFMGSIGFKATAYAEIAAWTGAMLMNLITYYRIMASKAPQRSVEKKRGRVALLNGVR